MQTSSRKLFCNWCRQRLPDDRDVTCFLLFNLRVTLPGVRKRQHPSLPLLPGQMLSGIISSPFLLQPTIANHLKHSESSAAYTMLSLAARCNINVDNVWIHVEMTLQKRKDSSVGKPSLRHKIMFKKIWRKELIFFFLSESAVTVDFILVCAPL